MEVLDFSNRLFHDIPQQDNPAYGSEECIMVVKDIVRTALFSVLKIDPVTDPLEDESVTTICVVYKLSNALKIAEFFSNGALNSVFGSFDLDDVRASIQNALHEQGIDVFKCLRVCDNVLKHLEKNGMAVRNILNTTNTTK